MEKTKQKPSRIMVRSPLTISTLSNDLDKVFTDEVQAFGSQFKPIGEFETPVITNSGLEAIVPMEAQKLLFLSYQYHSRATALTEDITEKVMKIVSDKILTEKVELHRIEEFTKFFKSGINDMHEIQKLLTYINRERMLKSLAWLIINENIGHDSTHVECENGIAIRKDWAIIVLPQNENNSSDEFQTLMNDFQKKERFGGNDDWDEFIG